MFLINKDKAKLMLDILKRYDELMVMYFSRIEGNEIIFECENLFIKIYPNYTEDNNFFDIDCEIESDYNVDYYFAHFNNKNDLIDRIKVLNKMIRFSEKGEENDENK